MQTLCSIYRSCQLETLDIYGRPSSFLSRVCVKDHEYRNFEMNSPCRVPDIMDMRLDAFEASTPMYAA